MYTRVSTWLFYIPFIWKTNNNSLCFILNVLIFRNTQKNRNTTLLIISELQCWIHTNKIEIINIFMWIIMNLFLSFNLELKIIWKHLDLFLNLELDSELMYLIDGNEASLEMEFNKISEFWSVSKWCQTSNHEWEYNNDQLKFYFYDQG